MIIIFLFHFPPPRKLATYKQFLIYFPRCCFFPIVWPLPRVFLLFLWLLKSDDKNETHTASEREEAANGATAFI